MSDLPIFASRRCYHWSKCCQSFVNLFSGETFEKRSKNWKITVCNLNANRKMVENYNSIGVKRNYYFSSRKKKHPCRSTTHFQDYRNGLFETTMISPFMFSASPYWKIHSGTTPGARILEELWTFIAVYQRNQCMVLSYSSPTLARCV